MALNYRRRSCRGHARAVVAALAPARELERPQRGGDLLREAVEDIDQLREALPGLALAERDAVGDAGLHVEPEDAETDAVERGFGGRELLKDLDAQSGFLNHAADAFDLPLDAIQTDDEGLLLCFIQHDFMLICGTPRRRCLENEFPLVRRWRLTSHYEPVYATHAMPFPEFSTPFRTGRPAPRPSGLMVLGHGSPVLVVPGIQGRWEWMWPALEALSLEHRVLTFSLSDAPPEVDCFEAWDACIDGLLDHAGIDAVTLVGVSFGGVVALHYAVGRPERVRALVLVSAPAPDWALDARRLGYLRHPRLLAPVFAARGVAHLLPEVIASQPSWPARARVLAGHLLRVVRFPASPVRMAAWARAWQARSVAIDYTRLTMPVALVTGEAHLDTVVPPASTLDYLHLIPHARHVVFEATGHIGLVTRPDAFARIVGAFA